MNKYAKKASIVDAVQFELNKESIIKCADFICDLKNSGVHQPIDYDKICRERAWYVVIDGDQLLLEPFDWIVKEADGEVYACPDHVFNALFKPI